MSEKQINDQLKNLGDGILTEETLADLEKSFHESVDELAQVRVEKALVEQDWGLIGVLSKPPLLGRSLTYWIKLQ